MTKVSRQITLFEIIAELGSIRPFATVEFPLPSGEMYAMQLAVIESIEETSPTRCKVRSTSGKTVTVAVSYPTAIDDVKSRVLNPEVS